MNGAEMKECERTRSRELMDEYIRGELSEAQREAFEEHYFECDQCFEELQFREKVLGVIQERGESIFADYITKKKRMRESLGSRFFRRIFPKAPLWRQGWVYAVVTTAIILILIPLLSNIFAPNKYEHLADIKPYPFLLTGLRSGATEGERLFQEGMRFYTDGEYTQSALFLEKAVALNPGKVLTYFFLGVSLLMEDNTGRAIRYLEKATVAQPDSEIFHWYLGQAYLKKGDGEKARKTLERVRDLDGDYRIRAEALIRKIEEIGNEADHRRL